MKHWCLNSATFMREQPCITSTSHNVFQTLKGTYDLSVNGIILILVSSKKYASGCKLKFTVDKDADRFSNLFFTEAEPLIH